MAVPTRTIVLPSKMRFSLSQLISQAAQLPEWLALLFEVVANGRQAHQAAQSKPWQFENLIDDVRRVVNGDTGFASLVVDINLYAHVELGKTCRSLVGQAPGGFESVD